MAVSVCMSVAVSVSMSVSVAVSVGPTLPAAAAAARPRSTGAPAIPGWRLISEPRHSVDTKSRSSRSSGERDQCSAVVRPHNITSHLDRNVSYARRGTGGGWVGWGWWGGGARSCGLPNTSGFSRRGRPYIRSSASGRLWGVKKNQNVKSVRLAGALSRCRYLRSLKGEERKRKSRFRLPAARNHGATEGFVFSMVPIRAHRSLPARRRTIYPFTLMIAGK